MTECYVVIRKSQDGEEWIDFETIRASPEGARAAYHAAEKAVGRQWSKDNPPIRVRKLWISNVLASEPNATRHNGVAGGVPASAPNNPSTSLPADWSGTE